MAKTRQVRETTKFIQIVPMQIVNADEGTYWIDLYALDAAGDVWWFKPVTMTTDAHWKRVAMNKEY